MYKAGRLCPALCHKTGSTSMARKQLFTVAAVIILLAGVTILVCMTGTLLALNWLPTPTPTNTPVPTWTPSLTPSPTPTLTNTPTPTFTPTPTPTFTPTPTETPAPTDTPTATFTPTTKPRPRATATDTPIPAPTNTPKPALTWTGTILDGFENCGQTRLFGFTRTQANVLVGGVWLHYWGEGGVSGWSSSAYTQTFGNDTKWEAARTLGSRHRQKSRTPARGTSVVAAEEHPPASPTPWTSPNTNCRKGTQVLWLDFRQN